MFVIVKQHMVQIDRIDEPTEYLSQIFATIRSGRHAQAVVQTHIHRLKRGWFLQSLRRPCYTTPSAGLMDDSKVDILGP